MYRFIDGKPTSLHGAVSFHIATLSPALYLDNLPGLLFSSFATHAVNTFTRRVRVRLSVSVRIMVNCKDRVRFGGTCPLIHLNNFFPVRVRVNNVVSSVYAVRNN